MLAGDGIDLIKLWFSVTRAEQLRRFVDRQLDPVKRWKLSPVDLASLDKWDDYTSAEAVMFRHTELPYAPWTVINGNDKRRARLEAMRCVLTRFTYCGRRDEVIGSAVRFWSAPRGGAGRSHRSGPGAGSDRLAELARTND